MKGQATYWEKTYASYKSFKDSVSRTYQELPMVKKKNYTIRKQAKDMNRPLDKYLKLKLSHILEKNDSPDL